MMQRVLMGLAGTVVVGVQGFLCLSVIDLKARVEAISDTLPYATSDRYTSRDADRDQKAQLLIDAEQTRRIEALERKLR